MERYVRRRHVARRRFAVCRVVSGRGGLRVRQLRRRVTDGEGTHGRRDIAGVRCAPASRTRRRLGKSRSTSATWDPEDTHEFVVFKTDLAADALPTASDGSVDEEGEGVELVDEIEDIAVGDTPHTLTLSLDAGNYVFIWNIVEEEGDETIVHYQQGMRTGFTVE
jgi:hypothetical protein